MEWSQVLTFTFVAALLVMSPGPNGVLVAKTVPTSGRAAGFANVAGFVTSFYLHGVLSILGISVILLQSAQAFFVVKMLGAAYLIWVGIRALYDAFRGIKQAPDIAPARRKRTLRLAYWEGFLTNALNPKVSMFYLAAFPQFIPAGEGAVAAAFFLVFIHSALNAIWFGSMVKLLGRLTNAARSVTFQKWLKAITGTAFIGFGIKLATFRP